MENNLISSNSVDVSVPEILYKYRSAESALAFLRKSQVYFSDYGSFNDPFECQASLEECNAEQVKTFLINNYLPCNTKLDSIEFDMPLEKLSSIVNDTVTNTLKEMGIFCLSGKKDSILMWSHYAENHKGVCLMFDTTKDPNFFEGLQKVNYSSNYISYNYVCTPKTISKVLYQKSLDWQYEEEYRIINLGIGYKTISKLALVGIIFGCRCESSIKTEIKKEVASSHFQNVKFYELKLDDKSYSLKISEADDSL